MKKSKVCLIFVGVLLCAFRYTDVYAADSTIPDGYRAVAANTQDTITGTLDSITSGDESSGITAKISVTDASGIASTYDIPDDVNIRGKNRSRLYFRDLKKGATVEIHLNSTREITQINVLKDAPKETK
ncbi:MAG: hypothetical protein KBD53_06940 [Candidatus Omnitrophica bacterium]|nr:hypothetical protein [Candidatus Omnitrophota bacterium]